MFMEALALKNANDRDTTCQVLLLGGACRVSSMCTTIDDRVGVLPAGLNKLDIAFIGASGLIDAEGFGVTNLPEVAAKRAFQAQASRTVIVCDAMKFDVRQSRLTNPPSPEMVIITEQAASERLKQLSQENPDWRSIDVRYCD
jgi:DeoR/GlpR family transcriptional regulator of sugar metabolism